MRPSSAAKPMQRGLPGGHPQWLRKQLRQLRARRATAQQMTWESSVRTVLVCSSSQCTERRVGVMRGFMNPARVLPQRRAIRPRGIIPSEGSRARSGAYGTRTKCRCARFPPRGPAGLEHPWDEAIPSKTDMPHPTGTQLGAMRCSREGVLPNHAVMCICLKTASEKPIGGRTALWPHRASA